MGSSLVRPLRWHGQAQYLGSLVLKNLFLEILTLGFYRFWGQARLRQYQWSNFYFMGKSFEYTGTGWEVFRGYLVACLFLTVFYLAGEFLSPFIIGSDVPVLMWLAYWVPVFLLIFGAGKFFSHRYRVSRTLWCGIRMGTDLNGWRYTLVYMTSVLLVVLTLGIAFPIARMRVEKYLWNNTAMGDQKFIVKSVEGSAAGIWFICWLWLIFWGSRFYNIMSHENIMTVSSHGTLDINLPSFYNFNFIAISLIGVLFYQIYQIAFRAQFISGFVIGDASLNFKMKIGKIFKYMTIGIVLIVSMSVLLFLFGSLIFTGIGNILQKRYGGIFDYGIILIGLAGVAGTFRTLPLMFWTQEWLLHMAEETCMEGMFDAEALKADRALKKPGSDGLFEALNLG